MSFREIVEAEMVTAAKKQDKVRLSTMRMVKSALHNREIDLKRELNDTEVLQLLSSMVKQRKDSIEQFGRGGREDLVEKEEQELQIIQSFMPQQLTEEALDAEIEKAIQEAKASSVKDMGKVMKVLMPRVTGKADGKAVNERLKMKLSRP
ncbi:GatB/YqeY domain-containing protein [Syntrophus aciditrophicus]|uniref:GatB/yqey domain protein n=1 Tax=Syntrophus aciditrophicus (strain SB) TaxID=56780 RepID=Q2LVF1_SYNAS|nr:GatB/YqeY domain-containing protein [Syntrophus aciditrophicus]ABC78060.1 gatB/yqey domain protein [Syntrophus aciditrophicus SB]OPY18946.1 MAG: Yqey-like protein [Syntrophus sp. PtaB.Bin075]